MQQEMQMVNMTKSIMAELEKISVWKLMMHLQDNGELNAYQIGKDLGWSSGKTHAAIKSLEKSNAVETRIEIRNNRAVKLVKLKE